MKKQQPGPVPVGSEAWKRVLKLEGEAVLNLSLRRPSLPEETAGERRVERYYARVEQRWRERWEGELYRRACQAAAAAREQSRPFRPWEASLDYTVTLQDEALLSLYLDAYEYTGGAHGLTTRRADTWEPRTGTVRTLSSFFPPRKRWRRLVLLDMQAQARRRIASGESLFYDDWQERMEREFDPERFYLTPEGLALFYPLYAVAPYAEGIPVFVLPHPDQKNQEKD